MVVRSRVDLLIILLVSYLLLVYECVCVGGDVKTRAKLEYIVSLKPPLGYVRPCLKRKRNKGLWGTDITCVWLWS